MKYRKIGGSDLEVSTICLGSWAFGGDCWGGAEDAGSINAIREALDSGINFIDTAPIYGGGRAESVIGKAVKGISSRTIIATKCGLEQKGKSIRPNLSPLFIREEVEGSLGRLGLETIDLYQCHWPDPATPVRKTMAELEKLKAEGKIRHIGVSNFEGELLREALNVTDIISDQVQYSVFHRAAEKEVLPVCGKKGISVLTYGSLAGGILTGKYKSPPIFPKSDARSFFYKFYQEPAWSQAGMVMSSLEEMAAARGVPVAHVAISWILSKKEVASCIVGCRTAQQAIQNSGASDLRLTEEELSNIEDATKAAFHH